MERLGQDSILEQVLKNDRWRGPESNGFCNVDSQKIARQEGKSVVVIGNSPQAYTSTTARRTDCPAPMASVNAERLVDGGYTGKAFATAVQACWEARWKW